MTTHIEFNRLHYTILIGDYELAKSTIRELMANKIKYLSNSNSNKNIVKDYINAIDYKGNTALHYASIKGNINMVEFLIEYGANLFIENNDGFTAQSEAAFTGNIHTSNYLEYKMQKIKQKNKTKKINRLNININPFDYA